jgi:hypothetical protein
MRSTTSVPLGTSFWRAAAVTLAWATLPVGVYGAFSGVATWGAIFTVVGLAALGLALSTSALQWAGARASSRALASLLPAVLVMNALTELWFTLRAQPLYLAPKPVVLVHAVVLLALTGLTTWQLARARTTS